CWAFTGESGEVTIKLASPTIPTAFALEHVAASISDRPGAAPRAVEVFGYSDLASDSEYKLGSFDFDLKKGPLQRFHATPPPEKIAFVKLKVHSNHGFGAFTCLYRFAVF
ncbi:SUN domain-containing protein, partial [Pelagophyceae sp. CCMP2097]